MAALRCFHYASIRRARIRGQGRNYLINVSSKHTMSGERSSPRKRGPRLQKKPMPERPSESQLSRERFYSELQAELARDACRLLVRFGEDARELARCRRHGDGAGFLDQLPTFGR